MDIIIAAVIGFVLIIAAVVIAPTIKLAIDIAPYLYTNTRCSARAALILTRKDYEALLNCSSQKELYAYLEETGYALIAEHSATTEQASALIEQELHDTYEWLLTVVPEKLQPIITAFLTRFEVAQLKEALNALVHGETIGELPWLRDEQARLRLEGVTDYTGFADALTGTPYEHLIAHGSLDKLEQLTTALDAHALTTTSDIIARSDAPAFAAYWKRVIDLANFRLAQRARDGQTVNYLPGGHLDAEALAAVGDENQLAELIEHTLGVEANEHALLQLLRKEAGLVNAKYALRGGVIVRYIIDKELEARNLNLLLKLKAEGFSTDEIRQHLV